ncbi:MAG: hypothetical protein ACWGQW_00690 [bacterium]
MSYKVNDVVGTYHGDVAIAAMRYISRGRWAGRTEYTVASLKPGGFKGNAYAMRVTGSDMFTKPRGTYTEEQIQAAVAHVHESKNKVDEQKRSRAAAGRDALGGWSADKVKPGDEVLIQYRGGSRRWEKVDKVNPSTGKVAIDAPSYKRGIRWLPANIIKDVRNSQKALPFKLTEAMTAAMADKGWHQVRFGSEFIEQSYVVASTANDARHGINYECASQQVYHDADLDVYWRSTGSFD